MGGFLRLSIICKYDRLSHPIISRRSRRLQGEAFGYKTPNRSQILSPECFTPTVIYNQFSEIPINNEAAWVEELVRSNIIENWEARDRPEHLKTIRNRVLKDKESTPVLIKLYREIVDRGQILATDSPEETELILSGLVIKQDGYLQVHNRIYELVFQEF